MAGGSWSLQNAGNNMIISNGSLRILNTIVAQTGDVGQAFIKQRLRKTVNYIRFLHQNQYDKQGAPYWHHPLRVMKRLWDVPNMTEAVLHAALLHDVVEDTNATLETLWQCGYPYSTLDIVDCVTRVKERYDRGSTYSDWIKWISTFGTLGTKLVKIADIADNMSPFRIAKLPKEFQGLQIRYVEALETLGQTVKPEVMSTVKWGDFHGTIHEDPSDLVSMHIAHAAEESKEK